MIRPSRRTTTTVRNAVMYQAPRRMIVPYGDPDGLVLKAYLDSGDYGMGT